jgi:hypothetical protein
MSDIVQDNHPRQHALLHIDQTATLKHEIRPHQSNDA